MLWLAALAGILVGLTLGTLGGGGSVLTVPILVYLLGQDPHAAITGSLLVVGATALAGALVHGRAGRVRLRQGLTFGLAGVPGAVVGAWLAADVDPNLLLVAFAAVMFTVATAMLVRWWRLRRQPAEAEATAVAGPRRSLAFLILVATGVGLLTGFLGVGGGFLVVPALTLIMALPIRDAIGTSLLAVTVTCSAALAARLGEDTALDWRVLIAFAAAAIAGSLLGGELAGRLHPARLTGAFAVLLLAVAAYTIVRTLPELF